MHDASTLTPGVALDTPSATPVSASPFRLDQAAADAACARLGAHTDEERAELLGISRKTLWRWREGTSVPRLDVIEKVCRRLDVTRDVLFPGL